MHNTKAQRETQCKNQYGYFNKSTQYCIILMTAREICVQIAKKEETGRWYLDSNRYNQSSYGCVYKPSKASAMIKYGNKVNDIQSFEKHFFSPKTNFSSHWPMDYSPMTISVRHSGDPLLAALNLTPKRGSLDFGEKSGTSMQQGIMFLGFSIFLIMMDFYYICKLNNEVNREKEEFKQPGR